MPNEVDGNLVEIIRELAGARADIKSIHTRLDKQNSSIEKLWAKQEAMEKSESQQNQQLDVLTNRHLKSDKFGTWLKQELIGRGIWIIFGIAFAYAVFKLGI